MSIVLTTLTSEEDERDNIEVEIDDFGDDSLMLGQAVGDGTMDYLTLTRGQLQQLVSWAIKEQWIDSIPI